jgi:predicted phosphodiesterase
MTRIFLLSDTHSYCDDRILHYANEADETWHAGDIGNTMVSDAIEKVSSFKAVYGNIDDPYCGIPKALQCKSQIFNRKASASACNLRTFSPFKDHE